MTAEYAELINAVRELLAEIEQASSDERDIYDAQYRVRAALLKIEAAK